MLTILGIIIVVSGLLVLFTVQSNKNNKKSWIQFYSKGKDAGFSIKEIELLRRLAISCNLDEPSALFWSQTQLELCIRSMVRSARLAGGGDQTTQDFLSKLYDYRKKIEMGKSKIKTGLTDSRQIAEGQNLRILVPGYGVFNSRLVKTTSQYLTIARPVSMKLPSNFNWTGIKLSVYFWREEDAGYVFDCDVQDEVFSRGTASLKTSHGESLFRTQKRKSVRIKTHKSAYLYVLDSDEPTDSIEAEPGLKCFVEDLSDTGCAALVGGKAAPGLRVKIQFVLTKVPICISGTVRSLSYNEETNRSLLHIEADPMTIEMRNHVLGEVFGMLPEETEDDLPFKIIEDEETGKAQTPGQAAIPPDASINSIDCIEQKNDVDQSSLMDDAL